MNRRHLLIAALLAAVAFPASAQTAKDGVRAWQRGHYDSAVAIWRPLAERGDTDAQFDLAQAYRLGRGVPADLGAAEILLQRAAVQGHHEAQTTLGLLLFKTGDHPRAMRWLKPAADRNDPRAMLVYGTALFNGDSVARNPVLGYFYVSRSAARGLGPAKATLAQMDRIISPANRKTALALVAARSASGKPIVQKTVTRPTSAKTPPRQTPTPPRQAPTPPRAAPTRPKLAAAPAATTKASGTWRIQLGAFSKPGSAQALFRKLSGTAPVAGRSASYGAAGAVTRLQVGPFASRAAAAEACRALLARGQPCFPVPAK